MSHGRDVGCLPLTGQTNSAVDRSSWLSDIGPPSVSPQQCLASELAASTLPPITVILGSNQCSLVKETSVDE